MKLSTFEIGVVLGDNKCQNHEMRIQLSDSIVTHSNGSIKLIEKLIDKRLPSEPMGLMQYRLQNIARITKTYFDKILATISKIQGAEDFSYSFPNKYLTEFFTLYFDDNYDNIFEWYFTVGLKCLLTNPNGYFVVLPSEIFEYSLQARAGEEPGNILNGGATTIPSSELYESFELWVVSEHNIIIDNEDYLVFKCKELEANQLVYLDKNEVGIFTIVEKTKFGKKELEYQPILFYELATKKPAYVKIGGAFFDIKHENIHESFVAGIVPFFNQALIEFSDKAAGIKQHVYPEKWRVKSKDCKECNGTGQLTGYIKGDAMTSICMACGGSAMYTPPTGMFSEHVFDATAFQEKITMPAVGYVQKDLGAIEFLDKDIDKMIHSGLAAVNMEFLMATPLNQSGVAKDVDRSELNNFVRRIAAHCVNKNLLPLAKLYTSWIYYSAPGEVSTAPLSGIIINVPSHYDLTGSNSYENKILLARQAGLDKSSLQVLEAKYINSKFANDEPNRQRLLLINKLNPLYAFPQAELSSMLADGAITELDYTISANISALVDEAIATTNGSSFFNLKFMEQKNFIATLATTNLMNNDIAKE